MKNVLKLVVGLMAMVVFIGCEDGGSDGGSSGGNNSGNVQNVAGSWQLTDLTYGKNATITLVQDGQIISGTVHNIKNRNGVIDGTLNSSGLLKMRFTFPAGQTDATLTVSGNSMSGTWVDHRDGTTAQISGARM